MDLVLSSVTWLPNLGQASRLQVEPDTPSNGTPVNDSEDTTTMVDVLDLFVPQNGTL
jgi:hypothetical protein